MSDAEVVAQMRASLERFKEQFEEVASATDDPALQTTAQAFDASCRTYLAILDVWEIMRNE